MGVEINFHLPTKEKQTMKTTITKHNMTSPEYRINCPICNLIFKGRSEKEADKNFTHHYMFKHGVKK